MFQRLIKSSVFFPLQAELISDVTEKLQADNEKVVAELKERLQANESKFVETSKNESEVSCKLREFESLVQELRSRLVQTETELTAEKNESVKKITLDYELKLEVLREKTAAEATNEKMVRTRSAFVIFCM